MAGGSTLDFPCCDAYITKNSKEVLMKLYSIFDQLAREYGPVFESKNDEVALRSARQTFSRIPPSSDFKLYSVGEFFTDSGTVESYPLPQLISGNLYPDLVPTSKKGGK
jgi:hypothetical protein